MKQIKNMYKLNWIKKDNNNPPEEDELICFLTYKHKQWGFGIGMLVKQIYGHEGPDEWRVEEGFEEWLFWKDVRYWCYREDFMKFILDKELVKFK